MIHFEPLTLSMRREYTETLLRGKERGCEYSFANLYLWGRQRVARVHGYYVFFSQFDRRTVYPFPVGEGDVRPVLETIMEDARERGITCRITGMSEEQCRLLDELYPGKWRIHCDRDSYDYVYAIEDLAELKGRKFQKKRNHLNKFRAAHPDCTAVPITQENLAAVREMTRQWYIWKQEQEPTMDLHMERSALQKALDHLQELDMEAMALMEDGKVIAITMGSRLSRDIFDIHFEKAFGSVDGAYTAINYEFSRYLRDKYPEVQFLNREDDLGLEGLRKAKLSYNPHHLTEKCWGCLLEDGYDY